MQEHRKTVCLHIGTHKTGTKTLQVFLGVNRPALLESGLYLPRAGRIPIDAAFTPGQHAIAWDFIDGKTSTNFDSLLEEIATALPPVVVVSSEDFQHLYDRPEALRTIARGFDSLGYATKVIVYLRGQASYAESLFGEYVKNGFVPDFGEFIDGIIRDGEFDAGGRKLSFDYEALVSPFASVFGTQNMIVRPYVGLEDPQAILRDFLNIVGTIRGGLTLQGLSNPAPIANPGISLRALLSKIYEAAERAGRVPPDPQARAIDDISTGYGAMLDRRFRVLTYGDAQRMLERFRASNERLGTAYGLRVPFLSLEDLAPESDPMWEEAAAQRDLVHAAYVRWNGST